MVESIFFDLLGRSGHRAGFAPVLEAESRDKGGQDKGYEFPLLSREFEHESLKLPQKPRECKQTGARIFWPARPADGRVWLDVMENSAKWYLRKHEDGDIFGPVDFAKLKEWTRAAQVSPLDLVSDDRASWIKAPMLQELHMDFLIQLGDDSFYGPTTEETVQEFLRLGEISADNMLINCCTGAEMALRDSGFFQGQPPPMDEIALREPGHRTIRQNLQQRIRELELLLVERRQQLEMADLRIRQLERRLEDAGVKAG